MEKLSRDQILAAIEAGDYEITSDSCCDCSVDGIGEWGVEKSGNECWYGRALNIGDELIAECIQYEGLKMHTTAISAEDIIDNVAIYTALSINDNDDHPTHDDNIMQSLIDYLGELPAGTRLLRDNQLGFANQYTVYIVSPDYVDNDMRLGNCDTLTPEQAAADIMYRGDDATQAYNNFELLSYTKTRRTKRAKLDKEASNYLSSLRKKEDAPKVEPEKAEVSTVAKTEDSLTEELDEKGMTIGHYEEITELVKKVFPGIKEVSVQSDIFGDGYIILVDFKPVMEGTYKEVKEKLEQKTAVKKIAWKNITAWKGKLQDNYDNDFEQFVRYDTVYNIAERLGFASAEEAWEKNPKINVEVDPTKLRVVEDKEASNYLSSLMRVADDAPKSQSEFNAGDKVQQEGAGLVGEVVFVTPDSPFIEVKWPDGSVNTYVDFRYLRHATAVEEPKTEVKEEPKKEEPKKEPESKPTKLHEVGPKPKDVILPKHIEPSTPDITIAYEDFRNAQASVSNLKAITDKIISDAKKSASEIEVTQDLPGKVKVVNNAVDQLALLMEKQELTVTAIGDKLFALQSEDVEVPTKPKAEQIKDIKEQITKLQIRIVEISKAAEPVKESIYKRILHIWDKTKEQKKESSEDIEVDAAETDLLAELKALISGVKETLSMTKEIGYDVVALA